MDLKYDTCVPLWTHSVRLILYSHTHLIFFLSFFCSPFSTIERENKPLLREKIPVCEWKFYKLPITSIVDLT